MRTHAWRRPGILSLLALAASICLVPEVASPQVPAFVPYSGRLSDGAAAPQATEIDLHVRLYSCCGPAGHGCVAVGGVACEGEEAGLVYEELHRGVKVASGYFSLKIGTRDEQGALRVEPAFPADFQARLWLEIQPVPGKKLPRLELGSVPYAMTAGRVWRPTLEVGETRNLGWFRSEDGKVEVKGADGSDLTPARPGWVGVPSRKPAGATMTLAATENVVFHDAGAGEGSNLAGFTFGVTPGVAWNKEMPVFIYACNHRDGDGGLAFGLSRSPVRFKWQGGYIGTLTALPPTQNEHNIFLATSYLGPFNWAHRPCARVGATTMRKPSESEDWEVAATESRYGFGRAAVTWVTGQDYLMPPGQNGAQAGKLFAVDGEAPTALAFNTNLVSYSLSEHGYAHVMLSLTGVKTTGDQDQTLWFAAPYEHAAPHSFFREFGSGWANLDGAQPHAPVVVLRGGSKIFVVRQGDDASEQGDIKDSAFTIQKHSIQGSVTYRAF